MSHINKLIYPYFPKMLRLLEVNQTLCISIDFYLYIVDIGNKSNCYNIIIGGKYQLFIQ